MNPLFLFLLLQASERIYNLSFSFGDVILFNVGTIEKLILIKRPPDYYKLFFCFRSSILLSMAFEVAKKVVFETESLIELTSVSYKEYQKRNEKKKLIFTFLVRRNSIWSFVRQYLCVQSQNKCRNAFI